MRREQFVRALWAARRGGLALACVLAIACAEGPRSAQAVPDSQGGSTEALKGMASVQVVASDRSLRAQAAQRVKRSTNLTVVEGTAQGVPVLSLQFDCGNDFVFMGRAIEHPYCNMLSDEQIEAKVTPPETAAASCIVSMVLSQDGRPVWWCKDTVRVGGKSDVVFATDRMVDRFTSVWRSANR